MSREEKIKKNRRKSRREEGPGFGIRVLYEDEFIIAIDKPPGLLSIASDRESLKTAYFIVGEYLKSRTKKRGPAVFIVHRLDRDTSGVLVFARDRKTKEIFQKDWENVGKFYTALVEGIPEPASGTVESYLEENRARRVYSTKHGEGRPAKTGYRTLRAGDGHALLEIELFTGKKNQIRVHLADIGHPVSGDKKYGAKANPLRRMALHSCRVIFNHPRTGKTMRIVSDAPSSFKRLVKAQK